MLGGLHQRFRKTNGQYQENLKAGAARRAAWLKHLIEGSPLILLTAPLCKTTSSSSGFKRLKYAI